MASNFSLFSSPMRKFLALAILVIACPFVLMAQDTIPHIKGTVKISVKKGTFDCDITLSNMPRLQNYFIRLNSGMNIRYIRNGAGTKSLNYDKSLQDTLSSGESSAYYIAGYGPSGKYLPRSLRFNYVGMYPVVTDTSAAVDWRGNIAFNGTNLRVDGIQSAWCPILYDVKTDKRYEKVTYDLEITCSDCKVIYVNGSQPVSDTIAKVKSNAAQDLTMFLGDFASESINGNYFLNPDATHDQLVELEKALEDIQQTFAKKLSIPYKGKAVYIQTTPVSRNNSWLFASYPTIVNISWEDGMRSFSNKTEGAWFRQYMAHELAHYYFGTYRTFNAELGDMISEGFAEYMALYISRTMVSDTVFREKIESKLAALNRGFEPLPMASIKSGSDYRDRELYVYYYAPVIFSAIEREIGENKMWEWMNALLKQPVTFTNYTFFEQSLNNVLKNKAVFESIRDKYFTSDKALQFAAAKLNIPQKNNGSGPGQAQAAQTYYYFVFSRPMFDSGTPENQVIKHTEIMQITCTPAELSALAGTLHKKVHEVCENETGCTSDFNTYDSMEKAQAALKRWLSRHNPTGSLQVKIIKP